MVDIVELKKKYRTVYYTNIDGLEVVFRPLTWRELDIYKKALSFNFKDEDELYDEIFDLVVLDPLILDEKYLTPAGLVPSISKLAIYLSGDIPDLETAVEKINNDIDLARQDLVNNAFEHFILIICKAFSSLTPYDVEQLEYSQVLRLLMMAEQILELEEPIKLTKPEKKKDLVEQLMEDKRKAEYTDQAKPSPQDIRDILQSKGTDKSFELARQIEMINRMKDRRAQG